MFGTGVKQYFVPAAALAEFENEQFCCERAYTALLGKKNFIKFSFAPDNIKTGMAMQGLAVP
jgi:hypothetical protein